MTKTQQAVVDFMRRHNATLTLRPVLMGTHATWTDPDMAHTWDAECPGVRANLRTLGALIRDGELVKVGDGEHRAEIWAAREDKGA